MGHLSGRARKLRLGMSFIRSFSNLISKTEMVKADEQPFITTRRKSAQNVEFVYYRNFKEGKTEFTCSDGLPVYIKYKQSFIGIDNYDITPSVTLVSSKIPIYVRTRVKINDKPTEVWIVENDYLIGAGNLLFKGNFSVDKSLDSKIGVITSGDLTTIVMPSEKIDWFSITSTGSVSPDIYIICLSPADLYTLESTFQHPYWRNIYSDTEDSYPLMITWGAYGAHYNPKENSIHVEHSLLEAGKELFVLASEDLDIQGLSKASGIFSGLPVVFSKCLPHEKLQNTLQAYKFPVLKDWTFATPNFELFSWENLPMLSSTRPAKNSIDYCFTSGHVFYKLTFAISNSSTDLNLSINLRHRGTFYLNNTFVKTHIVYNLGIFRAGSKNGPDNTFLGWENITLPKMFLKSGSNSLIVMVESFGLNRQPFSFNDIRCPRGIIEASIQGVPILNWEIAGVDVRQTDNTYNISGIPMEEQYIEQTIPSSKWNLKDDGVKLDLTDIQGPVWFKSVFDFPSLLDKQSRIPVRLCLSGPATCYVSINGKIIARYYGNGDGPQKDFYIPEGLLYALTNTIVILGYRTSTEDCWIDVNLTYWRMSESDLWSGNLGTGVPLILVSEEIK